MNTSLHRIQHRKRQSTESDNMTERDKAAKGRHNKLYRTPPTPPPESMMKMEKDFVLDCQATSSISMDYSKANPKLGPVISPYNGQKDKHTQAYYKFISVPQSLTFYKQVCFVTTNDSNFLRK